MTEQFANNAQTTLNDNVLTYDVVITIVDQSTFPTTGNFRIIVDSEIMIVTCVTGYNFYVIRGQENTLASNHTSGTLVTQVLTLGGISAAFARIDQSNDGNTVNRANQLVQLDSSGLLPESTTEDLRYKFRLLLLHLSEQGFEFCDELVEEIDRL